MLVYVLLISDHAKNSYVSLFVGCIPILAHSFPQSLATAHNPRFGNAIGYVGYGFVVPASVV